MSLAHFTAAGGCTNCAGFLRVGCCNSVVRCNILRYLGARWAFYVALFAWVVYAGIQIFGNWPAILGLLPQRSVIESPRLPAPKPRVCGDVARVSHLLSCCGLRCCCVAAQKDRLLGFDVPTWKSVLRLLVPRSVGSVKTAVSHRVAKTD